MDSIRRELVAVWQAEGVSLDPNGEPKPNGGSGGGTTTAAGQGDEGVSLDPNG